MLRLSITSILYIYYRLEVVVEPWMENLFPALKQFLGQSQAENTRTIDSAPSILNTSQPALVKEQGQTNGYMLNLNSRDEVDGPQENGICNSDLDKENSVLMDVTNLGKTISRHTENFNKNNSSGSETDLNVNANNSNVNVNANTSTNVNDLSTEFQQKLDLVEPSAEDREEGSLRNSLPPLSEAALSVPVLPPPYLKIDFLADSQLVGSWSFNLVPHYPD